MPVLSSYTSSPSKMFILLSFAVLVSAFVVSTTDSVEPENQAMTYLSQFGYLSPALSNSQPGEIMSKDTLTKAIQEFQSFAGLSITGKLDRETRKLMSTPRCGVKDKVGFATSSRSKRYALEGSRWRRQDLTYKITKYPRVLAKEDTDKAVRKAFGVWARVTPLTFTQKKSGSVDIEIRFERGEHGDGYPFAGPGGTLAHAFFPGYGGDAHFDDAEKWTVNSYTGTNLFQVAAHEFGHSLGLFHSEIRTALMAPFYEGYEPSFELDSDDVEAVQALYREKDINSGRSDKKPQTEEPPLEGEDGELCTDATIDTIFNSAEGVTYVFKGLHYWRLEECIVVGAGYPRLISKSWQGLPGNLDAAFTYYDGKTYFFKGTKYWRYKGKVMDGDYPKEISKTFPGIPNNIDTAMIWGGDGMVYFFKGSKFWSFHSTRKPPVFTYPISIFESIPNDLDAALQDANGYTYFFKGGIYYRFNYRPFMMDSVGYWRFGCPTETEGASTSKDDLEGTHSYGSEQRDEASHRDSSDTDVDDLMLDGDFQSGAGL